MFSNSDGIKKFDNKIWLASPTMHGEEQKWINDAFDKNWITTAGENINIIESQIAEKILYLGHFLQQLKVLLL